MASGTKKVDNEYFRSPTGPTINLSALSAFPIPITPIVYIMANLLMLLKISRPGLWLVFVWLYLWPTGGSFEALLQPSFWAGMLYCTFPLNLLVYGMNDMVDQDVDMPNPRKGNYIYGAKTTKRDRSGLPQVIAAINLVPLGLIGLFFGSLEFVLAWFLVAVGVNYVYNNKPFQLSRKCPFEVPTMIVGHFLIPVLSCHINQVPTPPVGSWIFHALLLTRSHIWLEYADIDVDRKEGKRTIAVALGHTNSLRLVLATTLLEAVSGYWLLNSIVLGTFSLFGAFVFALSASGDKTKQEKMHVSISQSLVGVVLMGWLWTNSVLTTG